MKKPADRTMELRHLIVDEVHAGMRRHGVSIPTNPKSQHAARRRFILDNIGEDEELYPDWLWAQLAVIEADWTPPAEKRQNFKRIESILDRIRAL